MTYAFLLDASACSGCKACQVACKDKNQLPVGVLWRRVYEVSGGAWKQEGEAWTTSVFTYNLSLSCNHCVHPKCAGVCPVDAYTVREDGIVLLDTSRCVGCGYCAWACPYGAPQYDASAGHMTKCNFCYDNIEQGLPPACVAACPLRVLDYAEVDDGQALPEGHLPLWEAFAETHPYPMPGTSRTRPHLAIKPHAAMQLPEEKMIANREEVRPKAAGLGEAPLVAFTLLVQMAVGGLWAMLGLLGRVQLLPMLWVGACLGAGMLMSFAHLGTKRNAWRVLSHLRKSWLSREILFTILFGAGWLATLGGMLLNINVLPLALLTGLTGVWLVHCMSQVYRLRTVPAWNTWRTRARFYISAGLLGILSILPLMAQGPTAALQQTVAGLLVIALLMAEAIIAGSQPLPGAKQRLQLGLIGACMLICAAFFRMPGWLNSYSSMAVLAVVLAEQVAGRWFFYEARLEQAVI